MRRLLLWFVVFASFVNAVPAISQLRPLVQAPINDELVGSGHEIDVLAGPRLIRPAIRSARRTDPRRRPYTDAAIAAIHAARRQLLVREPVLGLLLSERDPAIERNDVVGTVIWAGNTIMFNRAYVVSLTPLQLYEHVWQLGAVLASPA